MSQEDGGCQEDKNILRVHELEASAGYEKWEIHIGIQTDTEHDPAGQSQVGHPM